jgi:hypothetical protein
MKRELSIWLVIFSSRGRDSMTSSARRATIPRHAARLHAALEGGLVFVVLRKAHDDKSGIPVLYETVLAFRSLLDIAENALHRVDLRGRGIELPKMPLALRADITREHAQLQLSFVAAIVHPAAYRFLVRENLVSHVIRRPGQECESELVHDIALKRRRRVYSMRVRGATGRRVRILFQCQSDGGSSTLEPGNGTAARRRSRKAH